MSGLVVRPLAERIPYLAAAVVGGALHGVAPPLSDVAGPPAQRVEHEVSPPAHLDLLKHVVDLVSEERDAGVGLQVGRPGGQMDRSVDGHGALAEGSEQAAEP